MRLSRTEVYQDNPSFITTSAALGNTAYLIFKTRNLDRVEKVVDKISKITASLENNTKLDEQDKLSLKQFGAVTDLGKIAPTLETFKEQGFLEGNEKLLNLYQQSKNANTILEKFNEISQGDLRQKQTGIVMLDNVNKHSKLNDVVLNFMEKLERFFTKHWHGGILTNNKENNPMLVDNNKGGVAQKILDATKLVTIDKYEIDPIALIPKERHEILQKTYGSNWKAEICAKFHETNKQIHELGIVTK